MKQKKAGEKHVNEFQLCRKTECFDSKTPEFYNGGIKTLPKRQADVIKNNGNYVID